MNHSELFDTSMPLYFLTIEKAVPIFMILSGYVYALNAAKKPITELYNFNSIKKKFIRFTVPMLIAFSTYILLMFISGNVTSFLGIIKTFILGGYGPGSYYYHLMIEFIVLAPLMYFIIDKLGANGVIILGFIDFAFEMFCSAYNFNAQLYRIIIFRYLFAIALGMYAAVVKDKKINSNLLAVMLILGTVYVIAPYAWGYSYTLFVNLLWNKTSLFSIFYVFPIIYIIVDACKDYNSRTFVGRFVERIGKASYYIMYTQMIFYVIKPAFDKYVFNTTELAMFGELTFDIAVSVLTGILFEYVIQKSLKLLHK